MGRRGESVFKRKDGRWEARYKISGSSRYRSIYGKTYTEVKEKRRNAMKQNYVPRSEEFFSDAIARWLSVKEAEVKISTIQKYRHCINTHILPFFGKLRCSTVTPALVESFLQQKRTGGRLDGRGGLSQNTIRGMGILLQAILEYAYSNNLCTPSPFRIKKPKPEKKSICVLNQQEQRAIDALLLENPHDAYLAIYLALHTGMRIGEVCALKWEDVDLREKELYVNTTVSRGYAGTLLLSNPKSVSSCRTIPLTETLTQLLSTEQLRSISAFVFTSPRSGSFLNPRTLQYRFDAFLRKHQLTRITFHTLRHTFATRWIECGMDIKSLSEILGHTSVQITLDIYVHSSKKLKREAIERIEEITGLNSGQEAAGGIA